MTRRPSGPALHRLLARRRYELVPLPGALDRARSLPPGTTVTVTCSPSRGLEPTVALAEALAGAGYHAVPHLAARSVGGEVELKDAVERLVAAGVADVFVVGLLRQLARETDRLEVGLRGVHVYTFNQVAASAARLQALRGA